MSTAAAPFSPSWASVGVTVDAPTVGVQPSVESPLRLVCFPAGEGVGPFVTLKLGSGGTVFVHHVETATRLAEVTAQLVVKLRRLGVSETVNLIPDGDPAGVEP